MNTYTLYGTSACHLCEIAEEIFLRVTATASAADSAGLQKIDIADSDELFERYGVLIPVLADGEGRELRWPFSDHELARFLGL